MQLDPVKRMTVETKKYCVIVLLIGTYFCHLNLFIFSTGIMIFKLHELIFNFVITQVY